MPNSCATAALSALDLAVDQEAGGAMPNSCATAALSAPSRATRRPFLEALEDRCLPAQLAFATQPLTLASGTALQAANGKPIEVSVSDGSNASVTLALANNPGSAELTGTVTRTAVKGTAIFDNLVIFGGATAKGLTLVAYSGGNGSAVSQPFDLKAGAAYLHVETVLTTVAAGQNAGPITVQALDSNGTLARDLADTPVTLSIDKNPGGASFVDANGNKLTANPTATLTGGVAAFKNVYLDKAGIGYTLRVTATADPFLQDATTVPFQVAAGKAARLAFEAQPVYNAVGNLINITTGRTYNSWVGVTVWVQDKFGNPIGDASASEAVTIDFDKNPGQATLLRTKTITAKDGLASFKDLLINTAADGYSFKVTSPGLTAATSVLFNVGKARQGGLKFVNLPSGSYPLETVLPPIVVQEYDTQGNPITDDNTTRISLTGGGFYGTKTVTVVNGVATFDDIMVGRQLLPGGSAAVNLQAIYEDLGGVPDTGQHPITVVAGKAVALMFVTKAIDNGTAGDPIKAGGQPVQVEVVDDAKNVVLTDNTTVVSLGVLRTGAHPQPTFIGLNADNPGDPNSLGSYAKVTVHNGIATFNGLYINIAGDNYILSAGTDTIALATDSSNPFNLDIGKADHLTYLDQPYNATDPTKSAASSALGRIIGAFGGVPGEPVAVPTVAVVDRVGNIIVGDNTTQVTLALGTVPAGSDGTLQGAGQQVTVQNGVAVFDQVYVQQTGGPFSGYTLKATTTGLITSNEADSGPFTVNPAPNPQVIPDFAFSQQPQATVGSGQALSFALTVSKAGLPANAYDLSANVTLMLVNANGHRLPNGPSLVGEPVGKLPTNGVVSFSKLTITLPAGVTSAKYYIRALLDFGAQALLSNPITVTSGAAAVAPAVTPAAQPAAPAAPPNPDIVQAGLGSYTENFYYVSGLPAYALKADGTPQQLSQLFFPPSQQPAAGATSPPPMVQPNVVTPVGPGGFNQVPQSNDWWSSLMFQRTPAVGTDQRDSQGNRLYPMFADPFATMVNSGGTFAGLGLTYLDHLFVVPTPQYLDNPPAGQPNSLPDPRYPGNQQFFYSYGNTAGPDDQRLYQDIAVGLRDVVADAKVLSYSDWTATFDWGGKLQATLGEGLPFAYFLATGLTAGGSTVMQLTTADPNKTTTVTAFDSQGNPVSGGNGSDGVHAIRVHITYQVTATDYQTGQTFTQTVSHDYGLFLPTGVAWSLQGGTLTATLTAAKNYFSVAVLPQSDDVNATFNFFRRRAYTFVTGSTSGYSYDQQNDRLTTTYQLQTKVMESGGDLLDNHPLQALYVTQYDNLAPNTPLTAYTYQSARGTMKVFDGPLFVTQLTHNGTLPVIPPIVGDPGYYATLWNTQLYPYLKSVSTISQIDGGLALDKLLPIPNNNYVEAQSMFGAAQLIPILQQVASSSDPGLTAHDRALAASSAEQIFNIIKDRMGAWLSVNDDQALQMLYYQPSDPNETGAPSDVGWQSLMSLLPGFESSNSLNDHHLIAGYFLRTAAILATYDANWGDSTRAYDDGTKTLVGQLGDIIDLMVRDVSDPSRTDPQFPYLRNFDVYAGHSWADGGANDPLGNNQESASEAISYASGLIQWGEAVGDRTLRDLGVYLYDTEIDAFNTYYFNVNNTDAFPTAYTTSNGTTQRVSISTLRGASGQYFGFIGLETSRLAGIQMLPLTGASYYLGSDTTFVSANFQKAMAGAVQQGGVPIEAPVYTSVLYPYLALSEPDHAWQLFSQNLSSIAPINPGDSIDNLAYDTQWIKVLQAYGQVDDSVSANVVSYQVFKKNGQRTFVAYNADSLPEQVVFKDAVTGAPLVTVTVPGRTMGVFDANGKPVTALGAPDYSLQTPPNRFFFSQTKDSKGNNYTFTVGHAGSGESAVDIPGANGGNFPDTPTNAITFKISGLTGTLKGPSDQAFFSLWLDPQFAASGKAQPSVRVRITYDVNGDGKMTVTHIYDMLPLSNNPGYVNALSTFGGGLINGLANGQPNQPYNYPPALNGGSVTVTIWAVTGNTNDIRLRTDAAAELGRVSYLDLPYNFTAINNQPISALSAAPAAAPAPVFVQPSGRGQVLTSGGTGHTYAAALSADGTTATFTGNASSDTLVLTEENGLLMHNRFASGDPGFASAFDFDSTQPGVQTLPASAASSVIINLGTGNETVILGTPDAPASALLAHVEIVNSGPGTDRLLIDDGARAQAVGYTVNNGVITADDASLNVEVVGAPFVGGITLITGSGVNPVQVDATRAGEPLTLNTSGQADVVTVGDGSVRNIRGNVLVQNTFSFSDLIVDNSRATDVAGAVVIGPTSITGLAPATIGYARTDINDLEIYGGTGSTHYYVTGSIAGAYLYLDTGRGNDQVAVSSGGVVDDAHFPGLVDVASGGGTDILSVNNHFGAAKQVSTSAAGLNGLISAGLRFAGFAQAYVTLGGGSDTVTVSATAPGTAYTFDLGAGNNLAVLKPVGASVVVNGGPGNDTYVIAAQYSALTLLDPAGVDTLDFRYEPAGVAVNLRLAQGQPQLMGAGNTLALVGIYENLIGTPFNDVLVGNDANDVISGLGGDDTIIGGSGYSLLIGGGGRDVVYSASFLPHVFTAAPSVNPNAGGSLVIGGSTAFDGNVAALDAILAEWASGRPLATRIANLQSGSGSAGRLNGTSFLNAFTLGHDGAADLLFGDSRADWLLAFPIDLVHDRNRP
jgi:hypothetical protein